MLLQENSIAKVTSMVFDYMHIQLNELASENSTVCYTISNSLSRLIRKGSFTGNSMQLRVSHLDEGDYTIQLSINSSESQTYNFTKLPAVMNVERMALRPQFV